MRLYLDNCCFNRPFDDQSSLTIRLETEAKLEIQAQIKAGVLDALHIASAVALQCDYFLTVDKGILKKAARVPTPNIISPIDFIIQWEF